MTLVLVTRRGGGLTGDCPPPVAGRGLEVRVGFLLGKRGGKAEVTPGEEFERIEIARTALIALELRREVLDLMREGKRDGEIKDFLVQRYGEFVLYQPRVAGRTWLLWLGPAAILLAGAALVVVLVRRRPAQAIPRNDEPQEW